MRCRSLLAVVLVIVSSAWPSAAFAAVLTLNGGGTSYVWAGANDSIEGDSTSTLLYPTSLPDSGAPSAVDGASTSTTTFSLSNDGFDFVFDDFRGTGVQAYASGEGLIYFSPSAAVSYSFAGAYTSNAPDALGTAFTASLYDITTSAFLFSSLQISRATAGESFTLGQSGGDDFNELIGSPTGTVVPGHQYQLQAASSVFTGYSTALSTAHGTGHVTVTFVPEPSVGLLLLAGGAALAGVARRSSKGAARD